MNIYELVFIGTFALALAFLHYWFSKHKIKEGDENSKKR